MKKNLLMILLLIQFITLSGSAFALFDNAKITIKVINDNGEYLNNATVGIGFDDYRSPSKENSVRGITDNLGIFTGLASCTSGYIGFNVTKNGYYMSTGNYQFKDKNITGWQPWNPTVEVLLRKIENPVPMFVRETLESRLELPVANKDIGFDLVKFDWVIPYGQGAVSDFVFHLKRPQFISRDNYDATLTITFNNKYDGIQLHMEKHKDGSQYKLPRYAPETGYQDKLILHESFGAKGPVTQNFKFRADDLNYIFRVRSSEKDGKFERAMYGKILGYIGFSAMESKTAKIFMKYYLNPDYTRNLEFDPKRNLFGNLPDLERVTEP